MTNISIKNSFGVLFGVAITVAISLGAFASVVHAQEDFQSYGNDFQSYGNDFQSYGNDFQPYANNFQSYGNDFQSYGNDFQPYYNDFQSYGNDFQPYYNDFQSYGNDFQSYGNDFQSYGNDFQPYANDFQPYGNDFQSYCDTCYTQGGVTYSNGAPSYSGGCGFSCSSGGGFGGGYGGGFGGGCNSCGGGSMPHYSASPFSISSAPVGRPYGTPYVPPVSASAPASQHQTQSQSNSSYNSNPNTNTNVNNGQPINITNTNVNNNTAPVAQALPQQIVQYVFPTQPTYQNLSCSITASPNSIRSGQNVYMGWSSTGATSAVLSNGVGAVAPSGSLSVHPGSSVSYVLTVYGSNGQSASCTTYVTVGNAAPYVSLSQIPYTGFDFGATGNAIYWAGLLSFALAIAYLAIYYKGGLAFATARPTTRSQVAQMHRDNKRAMSTTVVETASATPRTVLSNLPARDMRSSTADAMSIVTSSKADEMPRIIISRN